MDPYEELARVYADAEHALSEVLTREVARDITREGDGAREAAERLASANAVRVAAQEAVRGLNGRVPPLARQVVTEAAEKGSREAAGTLQRLLGEAPPAGTIDRGRLDALAAGVNDTVTEVHNSVLRVVPDVYRDVTRRAAPGLLVGAQTRREAAQRAMAEYARRGVTGFTDKRGRRWELASYVEMTLRTVAQRTETDAQVDKFLQGGHELVMSTDSPFECALCRPFEGRVLAIRGEAGKRRVPHATRRGKFVTVDVVDTLDGARRRGYQHPNCGHMVVLYLPGVTKAPTGPGTGPDPEGNAARQRQREIERAIRQYKRRADLALDEQARKKANAQVRAWQGRMRDHLKANPGLRRLSYRESPGIGNNPTPEMLADPDGPFRGRLDDKRPDQLTDDELDEAMAAAIAAEDLDLFGVLGDESDKREEARERREARNARARERRAEEAARREEQQAARMEELIAAGWSDEEAVAEAYGTTVEKLRRDEARARLIGNGYVGTWQQMTRAAYDDAIREEWVRAENENRGHLFKPGTPARVTVVALFKGPEAYARRWASDELKEWWDVNGRLTYAQFVDQLVNQTGRSASGEDFLQ